MPTIYWTFKMIDRFLVWGLMSTFAFVVGCTSKAETEHSTHAKSAPVGVPVDGKVVTSGTLKEEIELVGTLVANQEVDIVSELTRKIVKVNVREGSRVAKGTLLFQLDDADLQAQLERFKQQEKLALLNEQRFNDLVKKDAAVQQEHDEAFTHLKVLQAQIQELQVTIDKTRITAPFAGQIGIIHVHPGAVVGVNTVLTNLQDNSLIKVEFQVPEKYAANLALGSNQPFTVTSDSKQYTAKVVAKEASLNQDTRTLLVRAITPNPKGTLLPGQSARVSLGLNTSPNALTINSNALLPSSFGYSVYTVKQGKAQLVQVQIGQRLAGQVEIVSGLKSGDTVITSNMLRLSPNADVQVVKVN